MLLELALFVALDAILEVRRPFLLLGTQQRDRRTLVDLHVDGNGPSPKPRRVRRGICKDDDGRFKALGTVDRHHTYFIGGRARITLDVDRPTREPGQEA